MAEVVDYSKGVKDSVFVSIPKQDMYDYPYPTIRVNHFEFKAGQTYKVDPTLGSEVARIMKGKENSDIRLLRPKKDLDAIASVERNSGNQGINMDR